MSDFTMPRALELEATKRNAIPAIRRQVRHDTTTQNLWRPGELCYIPFETGSGGAFTDTSKTKLYFDVKVRNKNFYTDFINLGRAGWHALISEFGIEINNGLHENNRHYAECVELDMIKNGENRTPFEMTRSNPYKVGNGKAGKTHINFIKPSMVTHMGLPHNVKYPVLTTTSSNTTTDFISDGLLWQSNQFIHESFGRSLATDLQAPASLLDYISYRAAEFGEFYNGTCGYSIWDDRIPQHQSKLGLSAFDTHYGDVNPLLTGTSVGPDVNFPSKYRIEGMPVKVVTNGENNILGKYSKVYAVNFDGVYANIFNVGYGQSVSSSSPGQWPVKQPCDFETLQKEYRENIRLINADNVQNYYANCKNIPVGIPLDLTSNTSGNSEIWGDAVHTKSTPTNYAEVGAETTFQVSLTIYSSLIGALAKKWFPECVVPAGRMRIRIRWQEANLVFQTLMDPCRRVPGTCRDYIGYTGIVESKAYRRADQVPVSVQTLATLLACSPEVIASGVHPIMISNYTPGECYNDLVAMGQYVVPQMRMKEMHSVLKTFNITSTAGNDINNSTSNYGVEDFNQTYNSTGNGGTHFTDFITSLKTSANTQAVAENAAKAINFLSDILYEIKQNQEYGYPWRQCSAHNYTTPSGTLVAEDTIIFISDLQQYSFPTDWRNRSERKSIPDNANINKHVILATSYDTNGVPGDDSTIKMVTTPNWDQDFKDLCWNPFCTPTPQYVPVYQPWDKTSTRTIINDNTAQFYRTEEELCYGTHLEHSVAQVRRSHSALYPLDISDAIASKIDERLTYVIENVRIITEQIILPQAAADSIIKSALQGGISILTSAWKEIETILPKAETQKILVNAAAAFVTDITFVFRPMEQIQGDQAYGHNSFAFYNPFTSFSFAYDPTLTPNINRASDYNTLGGRPIYYNEMVSATRVPIDVQLQLGSELLPRNPIDDINSLILYTRWGDQVYSSADYMDLNPRLQPSYLTQKGMAINTLQDGYFACFTPISALDDQTITCNPFYTPLEISLRRRIRGVRAPINALPIYKPYDGTFHLSFNLEVFTGQNDSMTTGIPVINNNMFLKMSKAHLCRDYDVQMLTVMSCDARMVFERGGTFQFYT